LTHASCGRILNLGLEKSTITIRVASPGLAAPIPAIGVASLPVCRAHPILQIASLGLAAPILVIGAAIFRVCRAHPILGVASPGFAAPWPGMRIDSMNPHDHR
jgi:hypothetical protein